MGASLTCKPKWGGGAGESQMGSLHKVCAFMRRWGGSRGGGARLLRQDDGTLVQQEPRVESWPLEVAAGGLAAVTDR